METVKRTEPDQKPNFLNELLSETMYKDNNKSEQANNKMQSNDQYFSLKIAMIPFFHSDKNNCGAASILSSVF